ncbi:uncharacterized protein BROUX77_005887 [Berkeleyomyces rouxiae]|uniref:uncharacterized protein n=1 Tax=Berkeleyomyces rouxiae TaxID=2035830 RepID=UPI003B781F1A
MAQTKEIYKAVGWTGSTTRTELPAVRTTEGTLARTTAGKADALLEAHVRNRLPDVAPPTIPEDRHPFTLDLTVEKVKSAVFAPKNTVPGLDDIPNQALKLAWEGLGEHITRLFRLCIERTHHPKLFKTACLVPIPKPGKADKNNPRSFRLISLLPTLGESSGKIDGKKTSEGGP